MRILSGGKKLIMIFCFTNFWHIWSKHQYYEQNSSISFGDYFEEFVQDRIREGRFKNVIEVIRASLRLLEEEESKIVALRHAIQEGSDSEFAESFYFDEHLAKLKSEKRKNG